MITKVKEFMLKQNMIQPGDKVIVGVSGGADSMCLLFVLYEISKRMPLFLSVLHLEHGIRGEESVADAEFVKEFCEKLQIPFVLVEKDCILYAKEHKLTVEEAGRILRYEAFEEALRREKADCVAVAHHKNDVAETMLFQLFRGSGIRGAAGITSVREFGTGKLIRPLLCVTREEIEEYLEKNKIPYRTDYTNEETIYSRNRIRHLILPEACKINSEAIDHLAETAARFMEMEEYMTQVSERDREAYIKIETEDNQEKLIIKQSLFTEIPQIRAFYVIRWCFRRLSSKWKDITSKHIDAVFELAMKQSGKRLDLPYQIKAVRTYDGIVMYQKASEEEEAKKQSLEKTVIPVPLEGSIVLPDGRILVTSVAEIKKSQKESEINFQKDVGFVKDTYTKWFDYDKIKNDVDIRFREAGDYYLINPGMKTQKLKTFFINEKIPADQRSKIMLLADGSHIMWIVGHRISEYYKISEKTQRIWKVEIINNKKSNCSE